MVLVFTFWSGKSLVWDETLSHRLRWGVSKSSSGGRRGTRRLGGVRRTVIVLPRSDIVSDYTGLMIGYVPKGTVTYLGTKFLSFSFGETGTARRTCHPCPCVCTRGRGRDTRNCFLRTRFMERRDVDKGGGILVVLWTWLECRDNTSNLLHCVLFRESCYGRVCPRPDVFSNNWCTGGFYRKIKTQDVVTTQSHCL